MCWEEVKDTFKLNPSTNEDTDERFAILTP